jgi:hypothetical protein
MEKFISEKHLTSVNDPSGVISMTSYRRKTRHQGLHLNPVVGDFQETPVASNCNAVGGIGDDAETLWQQLPEAIQPAVQEWAMYLKPMSWPQRRPLVEKFSLCFADNYRKQCPGITATEYDSLKDLGYTCLLELLDDKDAITNSHHARCFEASMHVHHQNRATAFWRSDKSQLILVH